MRWLSTLSENIKKGLRSWLDITPSSPYNIRIREVLDFETNAIRNRIWYRGDSNELVQLYEQCPNMRININFGRQNALREWKCVRSIPVYLV